MKKVMLCIMLAFPVLAMAQVDSKTKVYANNCNWTNSYLEFEEGDQVSISATGGWKSNGEDFNYHGASNGHRDARSEEPEVPVMALLVKFQDGAYSTIENFYGKDRIVYTFGTNKGRIYYICNDDMKNPNHCGDNEGYVTVRVVQLK